MPAYISRSSSTRLAEPLKAGTDSALKAGGAFELGIVLDQSSSMSTLVTEALAAFNALVDDQRNVKCAVGEGTALSLALFNDTSRLVYDALPIAEVPPLTPEQYKPSGSTALNDAIGSMIQVVGKRARRGTRVLVAILTDGEENVSRQFSKPDILQMVTYRRLTYDWQFVFIGPEEAFSYALSIGIPKSNVVSFAVDGAGLAKVMARLSASVKAFRLGNRHYALKLHN